MDSLPLREGAPPTSENAMRECVRLPGLNSVALRNDAKRLGADNVPPLLLPSGDGAAIPLTFPLLSRRRSKGSPPDASLSFKPFSRSGSNKPAARKALIVLGPNHSSLGPELPNFSPFSPIPVPPPLDGLPTERLLPGRDTFASTFAGPDRSLPALPTRSCTLILLFLDLGALGTFSRSPDESNIRDDGVFLAEEPGRFNVTLSNEGLAAESTEGL